MLATMKVMLPLHQRVRQEEGEWAEREGPEPLRTLSLPSGALSYGG